MNFYKNLSEHCAVVTRIFLTAFGFALFCLIPISITHASSFVGGIGTAENPYQINSCAGFEAINQSLSSAYLLTSDLDCSGDGNAVSVGGSLSSEFTGIFDGGGHTITVNINNNNVDVGLFNSVKNATIRNVQVAGNVVGGTAVGPLAGSVKNSVIYFVSSTANVGSVNGFQVGGLIGVLDSSKLSDSYATGAVNTSSSQVGGLIGSQSYSVVKRVYATGAVTGTTSVGGLVGILPYGNIMGGMINVSLGSIIDSFSTGLVTGTSQVGGFVGTSNNAILTNDYFDATTSGQVSVCSSDNDNACVAENQDNLDPTYFQVNTNAPMNNWDFDHVWSSASGPLKNPITGPMAYWTMDDNKGSVAQDSLDGNYNATLHNGATWTSGNFGYGISLNGTNQYADTTLPLPDSGSISGWVYPTAHHLWQAPFAWQGLNDSGDVVIDEDGANRWRAVFRADSNIPESVVEDLGGVTLNQWTHLAMTWVDNAGTYTFHFYVNGVDAGSNTWTGTPAAAGLGGFTMGRTGQDDGGYFQGSIDEVKVFNYAITQETVTKFANATPSPSTETPSMVTFDGGDGSSGNPYLISTCDQLQAIGQDSAHLAANYQITQNIDCEATSISDTNNPSYDANLYNGGAGFTPIGDVNNPFIGTINGQNNTSYNIDSLSINQQSDNVGLFGATNGATINDIEIEGGDISGGNNVGGIIGYAKNTTINYALALFTVVGGFQDVGGTIGKAEGDTMGFVGGVTAAIGSGNVGNVIGSMDGSTLEQGGSEGSFLQSSGSNDGGFAGYMNNSQVSNLQVQSEMQIGVDSTYANSISDVGGAIGDAADADLISNAISESAITLDVADGDTSNIGGLIGGLCDNGDSCQLINSSTDSSGSLVIDGGTDTNSYSTISSVGGLVGYANGSNQNPANNYHSTFTQNYSNMPVTITLTPASGALYQNVGAVGGVFGSLFSGDATETYSSGALNLDAPIFSAIGGFAGEGYLASIDNSFSSSLLNITTETNTGDSIGGLVGFSTDGLVIDHSYASGTMTLTANNEASFQVTGGLVGYIGSNNPGYAASISNSFSMVQNATTGLYIGGLIGNYNKGDSFGSLTNDFYYQAPDTGAAYCVGTDPDQQTTITDGSGTPLCTPISSGQDPVTYFSDSANAPLNSWDFSTVWSVTSGSLPVLQMNSQALPVVSITAPTASETVSTWAPVVNWDTSATCDYSYGNDPVNHVVNCSNAGSDIPAPSQNGVTVLNIEGYNSGGNTNGVVSVSFTYTGAPIPPSVVVITAPTASETVSTWAPVVNWDTSTVCDYSYGNNPVVNVVDCSKNGSDIPAPSQNGDTTLNVQGYADGGATNGVVSVSFIYQGIPIPAAGPSYAAVAGSVSGGGGGFSSSIAKPVISPVGNIAPANSVNPIKLTFSKNLKLGSKNSDVLALQKFLNSQGYVIAKTGTGSVGHEGNSFGNLTKKALMKFQKANGIAPNGLFGPMTRALVNKMMGN